MFSELQPFISSCPQDAAAPQTVQDTGGVSRGSAGAEVSVTTEGISVPVDQQQVLARSVTVLLLLTASCASHINSHRQEAILFLHGSTTSEL